MSTDMTRLIAAAQRLRELHQPGNPLILVNAWDVASARQVEAAGGLAVATSSAAVAAAWGEQDNNTGREAAFTALRRIAGAVGIPVTADIEGGYGLTGGELVAALLDAGAVGCNIEDTDHVSGAGLRDAGAQAAYLAEVRAAATAAGVPVVINARIDTIVRHPQRDAQATMQETLRRARLYFEAGADCVYPIALNDPVLVAQLTSALGRPVNVNPSDPLSALAEAGAARVSVGAGAFRFMMAEYERRAKKLLAGDAKAFS
jgi:2-methylisocitrate lyase-like PEP mutase family enzyme